MSGSWWIAAPALAAWALFGWSLLAVLPTPFHWLWKPAVAATEWGHWLGAFALAAGGGAFLAALPGWVWVPALAAAALFASPLVRALAIRKGIEARFLPGPSGRDPVPTPARPRGLVLKDLLHIPLPAVRPTRHVYAQVDGIALTLDLYLRTVDDPAPAPARPLVLVVHGGSWHGGDSRQLEGMNRYLAGQGYVVAALNYRLAPRYRFPAPLEDIGAALRFLQETETGLPEWKGVALLGRSSGGHLALAAGYAPIHPEIRAVIALYSPTDLVWSWQRPAPGRLMDSNSLIRGFLGGSPDELPRRFEEASPLLGVRPGLPPTLLIHGARDELVSPDQSRRLARALESAGVPSVHVEMPWGKHGMDANLAGPAGQLTLYAVTRFLEGLERETGAGSWPKAWRPAGFFGGR